MNNGKKRCSRCEKEKVYDDFYKNAHYKDGHTYICRDCCSEYSVKRYFENKCNVETKKKHYKKDEEGFNACSWREEFMYC